MQTATVSEDKIVFAYRDSGVPPLAQDKDYLTIIVIHGHTFHSGTFHLMLDAAPGHGYRVIAPNRRLYPGSTPYTPAEIAALQPGAPTGTAGFVDTLEKQGLYLLEFVHNMIETHGLKRVAVAGWSLGSLVLMMLVRAIARVSEDMRARLRESVKALISWDPANMMHGFAHPPAHDWTMPLYDETHTPEDRVKNFTVWVTGYFPHPDLESRDFYKLILHSVPNPMRPRTFKDTAIEEIMTMVDPSAAERGDSTVGLEVFWPTTRKLTEETFFGQEIRDLWGEKVSFSMIYGDHNVVTVIWAVFQMEEMAERAGNKLTVKKIPGGNHFPMIDDIPLLFEAINGCVKVGRHILASGIRLSYTSYSANV